jgi:putative DNA primase/helicase
MTDEDLKAKGRELFLSGKHNPPPDEPPPEPESEPTADVRVVFPPPSDPMRVARQLYSKCRTGDLRTLLHWRGGWMRWHTTHWTEAHTAELRSRVYSVLEHADYWRPIKEKGVVVDYERTPWEPNKRKVSDVMEAMAAIGYLPTEIDPPVWIAHSADAREVISCTNGLLDLSTRTLDEHTPGLFNVVSVPFDYQSDTAEPKVWLDFLASVWCDDKASIALLQQYFGYVLSGRTDMQKLLLLIGPTRSGKGTIGRILTALIGKGHVAGPTLASLGTNFGLSPLLGKPLAIISDARLGSNPTNVVVERLLSITGEDMLTVDRKFRDPWSGKLPTRFVILSNELPKFRDSSGAIANRMLILQMVKSFLGEEDRTLDERLREELPGILLWALDGLDRLAANGRFTVPTSSEDATNLMMDLASPMSAFVRERCTREPGDEVYRDDLYDAWKQWADDNGHAVTAKSTFGRDLRAVVPELRDVRHRKGAHDFRYYGHIGLLPAAPAADGATAGWDVDGAAVRPVSNGEVKTQFRDHAAGEAGASAFQARHDGFTPPDGPGRCSDCCWHVATQGHRPGCTKSRR